MTTIVETAQGPVAGVAGEGVLRFLGIPYAAPPFGERRMRPPQPHQAWAEVRDASRYGPTVPKGPYPPPFDELLPEPQIDGEDCLNLNVWTPDVSARLPVFVWVHGGAFANGSGAVPQYDGTAFARDGVVSVTFNYRLGADGFLDTGDDATNLGMRDQIAALEWVRENVAAFGGDSGRVTVGGESAGAMSVATLLASPRASNLFRRAVMQSGAGHHAISRETAQRVAAELARRLGVEATREAVARAPLGDLLRAQGELAQEIQLHRDVARWGDVAANLMPFEPVIDGDVVPALPAASIASGAGAALDVLIGTNSDEELLFMEPTGALALIDDAALRRAVAAFGFADPEGVIETYSQEHGGLPGQSMAALVTDWFFRIPAIRLVEARAGGPGRSYMYEFTWKSRARHGALGACHALELPFVFDTLAAQHSDWMTGPEAPQDLATEMHAAWVRFITAGEPGWDPYTPSRRCVRLFGTPSSTADDPARERRTLWEGLR
jgi:para-nitrobenzyl esterase